MKGKTEHSDRDTIVKWIKILFVSSIVGTFICLSNAADYQNTHPGAAWPWEPEKASVPLFYVCMWINEIIAFITGLILYYVANEKSN